MAKKRAQIEPLLPAVFREALARSPALDAMLDVMIGLQAPSETALGRLPERFDPRRTPDAWVPFLATWVGLDLEFAPALGGRMRELVAASVKLAQLRGTRQGLIQTLEIATGVQGFAVAENIGAGGAPEPFSIVVQAPAAARPYETLIERIVAREKPAYVKHRVEYSAS